MYFMYGQLMNKSGSVKCLTNKSYVFEGILGKKPTPNLIISSESNSGKSFIKFIGESDLKILDLIVTNIATMNKIFMWNP